MSVLGLGLVSCRLNSFMILRIMNVGHAVFYADKWLRLFCSHAYDTVWLKYGSRHRNEVSIFNGC